MCDDDKEDDDDGLVVLDTPTKLNLHADLLTDVVTGYTDKVQNDVHVPGVVDSILLGQNGHFKHLRHEQCLSAYDKQRKGIMLTMW